MESRLTGTRSWKWCGILFLCLIAAATSFAQGNPEASAPPIEILRLKWEKEVRLPRNFDPSVIPTGGTFGDPATRVSTTSPGSATTGAGSGTPAARTAGSNALTFPPTPGRLPVFYVYSVRIRNLSDKQIEGIAWDYVFIDPNGGAELGRHQFLSYIKAPPNKAVTLKGQISTPPIRIVQASSAARQKHTSLIERAAIQCVLFEDETVWRNPAGRKGVCEFLKNSETLIKQKPRANQHQ